MNILILTQLIEQSDHLHFAYLQQLATQPDVQIVLVVQPGYQGSLTTLPVTIEYFYSVGKLHLPSILAVRHLLRHYQIDLVVAETSRTLSNVILASYGLAKRPRICGHYGITKAISRYRLENYLTYLHPRVDHIIAISAAAKRAVVCRQIPETKVSVVYPDCGTVQATPLSRQALIEEYQLPTDAFIIGTAANFRHVKGIDVFLQTTSWLHHYINIHWFFLGIDDPSLDAYIDPRARARVHRLGHVSPAARWIAQFDLFVLASRAEGLGYALVEAMTLGVCPVATCVGGIVEAVQHEQTGLLVPSEDSQALAQAIERLYHDPQQRQQLARNAQTAAQQQFNATTKATQLLRLFKQLMAMR